MSETSVPTGKGLRRRLIGLCYALSLPGAAIVLACLFTLLELTTEQWKWFLGVTLVYGSIAGPLQGAIQSRFMVPVTDYLDQRVGGNVTPRTRREAFGRVMLLPRMSAAMGFFGWIVPQLLLIIVMSLRWDTWGGFENAVMATSGLASAFVSGSFLLYLAKGVTAPVRAALGYEIEDPKECAGLVRRMPIRMKLLVSVTGVTIVPVVFAVLLFESKASRVLEEFSIRWQHEVLTAMSGRLDSGGLAEALGEAMSQAPALAGSLEVAVIDLAGDPNAGSGILEGHVLADVRRSIEQGARRGDSARIPSRMVFAWHRQADGRILLGWMPGEAIRVDAASLWTIFAVLLAVSTGIAFSLAYLLANDVSEATDSLRAEAERLASGDLRRGAVFESEDELGELSRSFEAMAGSLRSTVGRVAEAADRVEGTAAEMSEVSTSVASVTADQVRGIQQTTTSMEAINTQVRGIADSAQALNVSVEESSSSVLELGAAGEELNETASVLSEKVNEVSSSIEQMVRSVKQVLENTEALSEAAVETSASMGEMATSMREVDSSAEETARLSQQVVESAESGQTKMVQTIEGMEAIREATETAEKVIRSLGSRTSEIGAILDVIDDVADETNLLALNAAIIAAQAGEHGRAFSVVADEIKDLADRVLASTKEIGGLIRSVQEESTNAIGAIEQGTQSVASGVDLTAEAGVSLEAITRASRESGTRIGGIVSAVREQARAAGHVVELMERVRGGVEEIRSAATEQDRGNEVVYRGSVAMRDVAQQVRGTTEEQARGSGRIRESVEGVREAVEQINGALQEQSASCRSAVEFLEAVFQRTRSNEESSKRLDEVTRGLVQQAEALREQVRKFRL
jgi:methyl-accepting chemotaxis protein